MTKPTNLQVLEELDEKIQHLTVDGKLIHEVIREKRTLQQRHADKFDSQASKFVVEEDFIENTEDEMAAGIQKESKRLAIMQATRTPKEAYFNILEYEKLKYTPYYVRFARIYVMEVLREFLSNNELTMLDISIDNSVNVFPTVFVRIISPNWLYYSETMDRGQNYFDLSPFSEEKVFQYSNFIDSNYLEKNIESNTQEIEILLARIEKIEEAIEKHSTSLLSNTKRAQAFVERLESDLQSKTRHMSFLYLQHENWQKALSHSGGNELEKIQNEFMSVVSFLSDKLGYAISIAEEN